MQCYEALDFIAAEKPLIFFGEVTVCVLSFAGFVFNVLKTK